MDNQELMLMVESLPFDLKIQLINRLLQSINPIEKEIDQLWAKEVKSRIDEIKAGVAELIDGAEVFKEARERLSK